MAIIPARAGGPAIAVHRFGPFELSEEARSLTLGGRPQTIQPRVFDLLAYLVGHAGRVVPKDELMDALWPDLHVTEASLQRAISLARRALAVGGLESAIRSYVRHGYRFAIDDPGLAQHDPEGEPSDADLVVARQLARERDWAGAAEHFAEAARTGEIDPEDLDLWAFVVECMGRPPDAIPVLTRAVSAHVAAGRPGEAARAATTLAKIEFERSAAAVAAGWLDRAEELLKGVDDAAPRAYLLWMRSRVATFAGRAEEALDLAARALAIAEARCDPGLCALTLCYKGFYNIALGRFDEGTAQQNHAAAIALSSQVDPITGSIVYCNILWSCRTFADLARARQWSEGFETWCRASFAETPGSCDLHRAEVIGAHRTLGAALAKIDAAIPKLRDEESWSQAEGFRIRGDINAMIGDIDAARRDYATVASFGWDAEPGNAVLLFEAGETDAALSALDRALDGTTWLHLMRQGQLLANKARIAALGGRREIAVATLAVLEDGAERWPQPAVRALIAETRAALLVPDSPEAIRLLALARQLWTSASVEFHAARVRLELATRLAGSGDVTGAASELAAVERTAAQIGSRRLAEAAAALSETVAPDRAAIPLAPTA